jgi:hypothetical protein
MMTSQSGSPANTHLPSDAARVFRCARRLSTDTVASRPRLEEADGYSEKPAARGAQVNGALKSERCSAVRSRIEGRRQLLGGAEYEAVWRSKGGGT